MADGEIDRVRRAYAAREGLADRYDPLRADQIQIDATRRHAWAAKLLARERRLGRVIEVGCGSGAVLRWARELTEDVVGVDLLDVRVAGARLVNPTIRLVVSDGRSLPFHSGSFDTAICSTLFSSVLDDEVASSIASELERVLAPDGIVLWFDLRRGNPRNADVRRMTRRDVQRLFPDRHADLDAAVLLPPVARRLLKWPRLAALLEALPPARSHLAGVLDRGRPPGYRR